MIYSDKNISLNAIASLNSNIYQINLKYNQLENEIKKMKEEMKSKDIQINDLNEKMENKNIQIDELSKNINDMKKELNDVDKKVQELHIKNTNLISPKENYLRLVNILDSIPVSKSLLVLYMKKIYENDLNTSTKIVKHITYLFNECGIEYFKISDECVNICGKIIFAEMEKNNKELNDQILKYFENKKYSRFAKYFTAIKDAIFGQNLKNKKNLEINLESCDIEYINYILRNLLLLEDQYQKEGIELKFTASLLEIATKYYKKDAFTKMINEKYEDVSFVNIKIITCLNKANL